MCIADISLTWQRKFRTQQDLFPDADMHMCFTEVTMMLKVTNNKKSFWY
jgi:hypothetical protein